MFKMPKKQFKTVVKKTCENDLSNTILQVGSKLYING